MIKRIFLNLLTRMRLYGAVDSKGIGEEQRYQEEIQKYAWLLEVKKTHLPEILETMAAKTISIWASLSKDDPAYLIKSASLQGELNILVSGLLYDIDNAEKLLKINQQQLESSGEKKRYENTGKTIS